MGSQWRPLPEELPLPARLLTERLRALKDANALSLADISAATHYSRASWERWLNGKRLITRAALLGFAETVGADAAPLLVLLDQAGSAPRGQGGPVAAAEPDEGNLPAVVAAPAPPESGTGRPLPPVVSGVVLTARRGRRVPRRLWAWVAGCCVLLSGVTAVLAAVGPGASGSQLSQGRALSTLLNSAADNRAVAVAAVVDIEQCQNLGQAAADLGQMARLHGGMVGQLARLSTDRLAQHQALVAALDQGWQASQRADQDYARWAQDSESACGRGHRPADTAWKLQGDEASAAASAAKQRAAVLWNAVAEQNGLPPITADQL